MTTHRLHLPLLSLLLLAITLSGCLSNRQASSTLNRVASDNCNIDSSGTSGYVFHPINLVPGSPDDLLLRQRFGERGLRMAQAVGLTHLLVQMTQLEQQNPDQPPSNQYLAIRQKLTDQLQLANFDIATAAALVDCDSKRATLTATLLTRRENSREKRMTISAITIGAVAIIGASLLNLHEQHQTADWLHIAGGVGEGGLGVLALRQKPPHAEYRHPRNPLRDIWNKSKTSTDFPPLVWYYLNKPKSGNSPSLVDALRSRWELLVALDEKAGRPRKHTRREVAYFSDGDTYTAEELTVRAAMLGQLETELRLMNNDLTILLNEIVRPITKR
ncbi:hypothetical protein [Spirosoma agri]|uniref:Uncharacterized protein n=1 Tax=Spirosoma agri TaxID=1987381 RepID=A0A6M0IT25_9BACT|nr:hypothetical protein [Spirosoma agri]NEU70855.1 hypothetical protein [Spirosoma agri]